MRGKYGGDRVRMREVRRRPGNSASTLDPPTYPVPRPAWRPPAAHHSPKHPPTASSGHFAPQPSHPASKLPKLFVSALLALFLLNLLLRLLTSPAPFPPPQRTTRPIASVRLLYRQPPLPEMSSSPIAPAGIPAAPATLEKKPVKFSNLLRK